MQPFENQYRKIVRFGGLYDLIATFPLALPGLVSMQLETLEKMECPIGRVLAISVDAEIVIPERPCHNPRA